MKIKKGTVIALTEGRFSDYCLMGHVIALRDFDTEVEHTAFRISGATEGATIYHVKSDWVSWMIREQIIEPAENVVELYLGSYSYPAINILPSTWKE